MSDRVGGAVTTGGGGAGRSFSNASQPLKPSTTNNMADRKGLNSTTPKLSPAHPTG
jgi:hypothetical protein